MEDEGWSLECGGWRMDWRVEDGLEGGWWIVQGGMGGVEGGGWRLEVGGWRLEVGGWRVEGEMWVEVGGWRVEAGGWRLENGKWRVEVASPKSQSTLAHPFWHVLGFVGSKEQ